MWDGVVEVLFALPQSAREWKESERLEVFQLRINLHVNLTSTRLLFGRILILSPSCSSCRAALPVGSSAPPQKPPALAVQT